MDENRQDSTKQGSVKDSLNVSDILDNFKKSVGIKTNKELAEIFQVQPNTISTWKSRNSIDYERLIQASFTYNVNLNQLFFKKEQVFKKEPNDTGSIIVVPKELQYQYVSQRDKMEFITDLPQYNFPFIDQENHRAFELINPSFYTRGKVALAIGEMIGIEEMVEGKLYTVVSKVCGIITGFVAKKDPDSDFIYLKTKDVKFTPGKIKISLNDCVEIWRITTIVSFYMEKHGIQTEKNISNNELE